MTLAGQVFLSSIPILISLYAARYRQLDMNKVFKDYPKDFGLPVEEVYDYIIVGGGTAGCVLARRLSDANLRVLLLEAGGNPPPLQEVPFVASITKDLDDINFLYKSIPQKNAALIHKGILQTPAGKMMGGSSSHNDQLYERGHPLDYKNWAELTSDESWEYPKILKYFKRAENYHGKFRLRGQHGKNGPMTVTRPRYAPGRSTWLKAGKELGFNIVDSNGPQQQGFSPNEFTKKFGRRVSTYNAYIQPIEKKRKTLIIRRYSLVSKILFHNKMAVGVEYTQHGLPKVARAVEEVIISTGVFMSPILLIKSGIGPKDELKRAKVKPISILEGVGENLMDHPYLEVAPFFVSDHSKAWHISQNLTFNDFSSFLKKGDGPLVTSFRVGQGEAFIASRKRGKEKNWPDLQFYYTFMGSEVNALSCYVGLNRPLSRGRITYNSRVKEMDSRDLPIIDYSYFSEETDFTVMIEGIQFCLNTIENTKAFQDIGAKFSSRPIPHCQSMKFRSNEYWKCYIRHLVDASYHVVGTCKMGTRDDPMAVVDSKLKVLGVERLRIVDASVMPVITNANTAAPTVMIAEKTAESIIKSVQAKRKRFKDEL